MVTYDSPTVASNEEDILRLGYVYKVLRLPKISGRPVFASEGCRIEFQSLLL